MSTPQSGSPSNASSYRQYVPAAVSIVLGGAVTLAVFWAAYSFERRSVRGDFDALADARFQAIDSVFEQFTRLVAFADNVFMVAPPANSPGFPDYVRSLKRFLEKDQARYPAIDAMTWIPRVETDEADAYQQTGRTVIYPKLDIQRSAASTEGEAPARAMAAFPTYLSVGTPLGSLKPGQDMALDPDAWKAMTQARDTGQIVAMRPIPTSNNADDRFGYRLFQPLYRDGDPGAVAQRREASAGFLCIDLDVGVLVGRAFEDLRPVGVDIWVLDNTEGKDSVLCRHTSRLGTPTAGKGERWSRNEMVAKSARKLLGRDIALYGVSTPAFWSSHVAWQPWVILCIGLTLTVAIAAYQYNLAVRAAAIDRAVTTRIDSLRLEREQHEANRQQSRRPPNSSPNDVPPQPTLGAPIETNESQSAAGGFNAGVPE